jgi:putative flippase GtrA
VRLSFVLVGLAGTMALAAFCVVALTRCQNPSPLVSLGVLALDLATVAIIAAAFVAHARHSKANPSTALNEAAANFLGLLGLSVVVGVIVLAQLMVTTCPPL